MLVAKVKKEGIPPRIACDALNVSRAGFYKWSKAIVAVRSKENKVLKSKVIEISKESRGTYGEPRIRSQLRKDGFLVGKGRVVRLMKDAGVSGLPRRRFKPQTTVRDKASPVASRIFETGVPSQAPIQTNKVWVGDISYIPTSEGFLYLAIVMDACSRKILGFSTSSGMPTSLVVNALEAALLTAGSPPVGLIYHSDQGSQYTSREFRSYLEKHGVTASMSRKGNCYDNAYAESFFSILKKELVHRTTFKTRAEAEFSIFEFIEVWYNRKRLHSSLGYRAPAEFEASIIA